LARRRTVSSFGCLAGGGILLELIRTHFGSAKALTMEDVIFAQYREVGVLYHRGFSIDDCVNQCFSNVKDLGKGRQMPLHYGYS